MSAEHHNKDFQKAALAARGRVADSPTTVSRAETVGNSTTTLLLLDDRSFLRSIIQNF